MNRQSDGDSRPQLSSRAKLGSTTENVPEHGVNQ
jgi:hypothetical protein